MAKNIAIGIQDFGDLIRNEYFYIDKTAWIREWWESGDLVTLITRPRRFGKTLNMSMLEYFFANRHEQDQSLFEKLEIWKDPKYRKLQGTFPVISLSFANIKEKRYADARKKICQLLTDLYADYAFLKEEKCLEKGELAFFDRVSADMDDADATMAVYYLSKFLCRYYGKKVIILLDEYDTPMQEAYVDGYWKELTSFTRGLLNASFKTNPWIERGVMTGITRVSKESVFSDLNNLEVVTTTSEKYSTAFGFTEKEVFQALEDCHLEKEKEQVKRWYDGFIFGQRRDIYNPWSITNYLKEKKLKPYWAATSSNALISKLIQTASADMKKQMERLLNGELITVSFDEQVVFSQLEQDESAIWSLLVASGYLKVEDVEYRGMTLEPWYHLDITNLETVSMFSNMFKGWFAPVASNYNEFIRALLEGNVKAMNLYMNDVALATFSSFDVGKYVSERTQPERFYHGFVLGLLIEIRDRYDVRFNRESGFGRYDVMLLPKSKRDNAIILEFKVREPDSEKTLEDTVESALDQIIEKKYDAELLGLGITQERIRHYGFAFEGKKVLIG